VQDRAGQTEPRIPTCKELRAQAAKAAPVRLVAVVLEAEAPKNEVQALPVEAADQVAVVWGVPEPVAAGAAAVEVVAEQGIKSELFLAWTVALELLFLSASGSQRVTQRKSSCFV
jgi:hypothetical protein